MQTIKVRSILWLLFLRDWPWKVLSLAIAIMIYFSVRSEISYLRTFAVPIMGDVGCVVTSAKPQTVHVTLRGSETELNQLYTPAIYVAVAPVSKGTNEIETIRLKSSALRQIGSLRVVRIEPNFVNVRFERPIHIDAPQKQQPPEAPKNHSPVLTNHPPTQPEAVTTALAVGKQTIN
jgi:hypothetical protein